MASQRLESLGYSTLSPLKVEKAPAKKTWHPPGCVPVRDVERARLQRLFQPAPRPR